MAVRVAHDFVSAVPDSDDTTLVRPSNWNADHTIEGLGTAAEADTGDFATAAQGAKADTAVQPAAIADMVETTDTDASGFDFVIDEDDMASDSATKVPTQQSVKAYADTKQTAHANLTSLSNDTLVMNKVGGVDRGVDVLRTFSGSSAVGLNGHLWNVTADDAEIDDLGFVNMHTFQTYWGGGKGGRQNLFSLSRQTSPMAADSGNRNYVSGSSTIRTASGDDGVSTDELSFSGTLSSGSPTVTVANTTGLVVGMTVTSGAAIPLGTVINSIVVNTSITMSQNAASSGAATIRARGARGAYFAHAFLAVAEAGAANLLEVTGAEVNVIMEAGSSARYKFGWSIAGHASDAVEADELNAMLVFTQQTGGVEWQDIILIDDYGGDYPMKAAGSILRVTGGSFTDGIDFSGATVSGSLLKGAAAFVRESGTFAFFGSTTGSVVFQSLGHNVLTFNGVSGGDNQIAIVGQASGSPAYLLAAGLTANLDFILRAKGTGTLDVNFQTATTVGAAGGASALPATPLGYALIKINGTTRKFPYYNT